MRMARRGFVLIFVLWTLVTGAALAIAAAGFGRAELGAIQHRMSATRARWTALGCVDRYRAGAEAALWAEGFTAASVEATWNQLDELRIVTSCSIEARPAGMTVDVNTATPAQLRRLFELLGLGAARSDSLAATIVDWRDTDDEPSPNGAEGAWYRSAGRVPPANRPFTAIEELRAVRGMDDLIRGAGVLGIGSERILWRRASPAVIATLPGITDDALAVLAAHDRSAISDLTALESFPELSAAARDSLARASSALMPLVTSSIEGWTVSAGAVSGNPAIRVTVSARLVLRDGRLQPTDWRVIP